MTEIVGNSKFKSDNAYGQDGSSTPSSLPSKQTPAFNVKNPDAMLVRPRDPVLTDADASNFQTRTVSAAPIPPAFGHKNPNSSPAKVPMNSPPVFQRPLNSTFKRGK